MSAAMAADVTSPTNALVKRLVKLRERRTREREGVFLVEGARELTRAVQAEWHLDVLATCPELHSPDATEAAGRLHEAARDTRRFGVQAFERASVRQNPDGLMGVVRMRRVALDDLPWPAGACYLVIAGLEKPGNVGALLRTASAAAVEAVFVTHAGTDLGNPNVVRASMGSLFSLPVLTLSDELLRAALEARGVRLVTTTPTARTTYWDADLSGTIAIVVGPEHEGLDAAWRDAADVEVGIPMAGAVDSLNAAASGALVLFEVVRRRRLRSADPPRP
ncbi:MAG: RNA methyltransferase [Trueperaceae bacterium]|nr:RNA methyltransferase [Trueperaceae bacterium]